MQSVDGSNEGSQADAGRRYVVISPVKNEADYIQLTLDSMVHQTITPAAWIIVNDGSQDETEAIVRKYAERYAWIRLVNRSGDAVRKRGKGVVEAFYAGYATLREDYDFIVKLDGDLSFEPTYFESLLLEFEKDTRLGIAGGALYEKPDGKNWYLYTYSDEVRGCIKMYRRACFEAIGGLVPAMGWDGIDEWTAFSSGWRVRSFFDYKVYHYRFTGMATGLLKSFAEQGYGAYSIGYHPLFLVARGVKCMLVRPFVIGGLAMIVAFFRAGLERRKRLSSPSVIQYIHKAQMRQLGRLVTGRTIHGIRQPAESPNPNNLGC
jgi:glycosyltransferase involved in cell wall biosynthesis